MKNYIVSERTNLFEPNVYIQFFVKIEGVFSLEDLLTAVKSAYIANETTMSKVVLEKGGLAFYEKMNESGCKVSIVHEDWRTLIRENEKVPFNIEHGELIRTFVIPSEEGAALLIMAHHLVGDGKSITFFLEDIMKALTGKKLDYKPVQLIKKESFPQKSRISVIIKLYVSRFNRKWKRMGSNFTWEDYYKIHKEYWKNNSSRIIYETFSKEEMSKIKGYAKKAEVSLNSYIVTAFLEANRRNKTVGIPIDIRKDSNRAMSNQTSGISVDYIYSDSKTFGENAAEVHSEIYKRLEQPNKKYFVLQFISLFEPFLLDSVLLYTYGLYNNAISKKLAKVMGYEGGKTRELGITNLAKLDISDVYGEYKVKNIIFVPPVVSYAKHIIGVSTIGDEMTITYHYMNDQNETEEKRFFERGINNLKS